MKMSVLHPSVLAIITSVALLPVALCQDSAPEAKDATIEENGKGAAESVANPAEAEANGAEANGAEAEPTREELEAKFIATLKNATMAGRWCLIRDGELTPDKEDRYEIRGISKTVNGNWLLRARIKYGSFDMVLPVPVKVEWAGDTPVIIVDRLGIPGGNLYSARVVIYDDSYAGTWSGGSVKGLLNGMITRDEEAATGNDVADPPPAEAETPVDKE